MKKLLLPILLGILFGLYGSNTFSVHDGLPGSVLDLAQRLEARDRAREEERQFQLRVARVRNYLVKNGSPLANYAEDFVKCAQSYEFPDGFLVGIARAESSLGRHYALKNNFLNWGVHNGRTFDSVPGALCHVARGIRNNYDTSSVLAVANKYAPKADGNNPVHWAETVTKTISEIERGGEE